jgi:ParB family chromosome partitioning protein
MEKRRLGRGLDALLGHPAGEASAASQGPASSVAQAQVPVDRLDPNPYQPRKTFDEDELKSLSASIRTHGILQPLVVRAVGDRYQIVAGERRLRAAQEVGVTEVPVRIVDFNDQQVLEAALVENIQRTDLNPIEKAQGFHEYLQRFRMTHEQLAGRLGLDRSTITNLLRLLELPSEVQEAVRVGQISAGHGRAILAVSERERQLGLCKDVIARGLSVRATEALAKEQKPEEPVNGSPRPAPEKTTHVQALEDELRQRLSTRVEIRVRGKDRGQIVLGFESNDDFERILEILRK